MVEPQLWCWRHPKTIGAAGRCIGRSDLAIDARKAKRLAHRIRQVARAQGLPRVVHVSPLQRSHAVGRWLRRWGFALHVDARLAEMDFGAWDGQPWSAIAWPEVQAWEADLRDHAAGGGESLQQVADRVQAFIHVTPRPALVVTHGGWLNVLGRLDGQPGARLAQVDAAKWPSPPRHGALRRWPAAD